MRGRFKKVLLLILVAALLTGSGFLQNSMNHDRDALGLTHVEGLTNAPPVLAFTTVALGGFRGLISNILWSRENELQNDDKYFEMAQLSDWITKLEPHFSQVWVHEAWNMAYNISVKFPNYADRWRWVQNGMELLYQGLRYNPDDVLIHRELAWFFQHKMGANLDDANMYYKTQWKQDMEEVFGGTHPDFDALIHPKTSDEMNRARLLREKYKMDPVLMKQVDAQYGPLEWRLPEAHAIYWSSEGLERATNNLSKVKADDLIQLRRVIYQSMLLGWQRGRIVDNPYNTNYLEFGPNLEIIPKVNDTYLQVYAEESQPNQKDGILNAHRNFLRQAVYYLYVYDRMGEAEKWFKYLGEKYPDKTIIDGDLNSYPRNVTLDQYAVSCVQTDINETSKDRVTANLEGMLRTAYVSLVLDRDDRAAGLQNLARLAWKTYESKIPAARTNALDLAPLSDIAHSVRAELLNPTNGMPPRAQAVLRTKLNIPEGKIDPVGTSPAKSLTEEQH